VIEAVKLLDSETVLAKPETRPSELVNVLSMELFSA
jgi:hypothetical protein